jgi:hypothetical protein
MRVAFTDDPQHRDIHEDADFLAVAVLIHGHETARRMIADILRTITQPMPESLEKFTRYWTQTHGSSPADIEWVEQEVTPRMNALYGRFDPGRLRGVLTERLVYEQITSRYAHNTLKEDSFVHVSNGASYDSSTSVDVAGYDGNVGECHDCKARCRQINFGFLRELETHLPPSVFKIGVVSTDTRTVMAKELRSQNYTPGAHTTVIPLEDLWDLAPLQSASPPPE